MNKEFLAFYWEPCPYCGHNLWTPVLVPDPANCRHNLNAYLCCWCGAITPSGTTWAEAAKAVETSCIDRTEPILKIPTEDSAGDNLEDLGDLADLKEDDGDDNDDGDDGDDSDDDDDDDGNNNENN